MTDSLLAKISGMVQSCGATLYDAELVRENDRQIFRVSITSPEGASLEKCEEISRILSPLLDIEEPTRGNYFFEVSSPGVERPLKKPAHYAGSIGEQARIKLKDGQVLIGEICAIDQDKVTIRDEAGEHLFSIHEVKTARTIFNWES